MNYDISTLNDGQTIVRDAILSALSNSLTTPELIISGRPGTGKSHVLAVSLATAISNGYDLSQWAIVAPTHKAKGVLEAFLESHGISFPTFTLAGYLGKFPELDNAGNLIFSNDGNGNFSPPYLKHPRVIADEASMITASDLEMLRLETQQQIFIGDKHQLPPVGEDSSAVFNDGESSIFRVLLELTEVVRNKGSIRVIVEHLYEVLEYGKPLAYSEFLCDEDCHYDPLWIEKVSRFRRDWENGDKVSLAYTNQEVSVVNRGIHRILHGSDHDFSPGEKLLAYAPIWLDENVSLPNSTELWIKKVQFKPQSYDLGGRFHDVYELTVSATRPGKSLSDSNSNEYIITVPSFDSAKGISEGMEGIRKACAQGKIRWGFYRKLMNELANVRHSYCMTIHKSQGSTFRDVHLLTKGLSSQGGKLKNSLLYVAFSRASKTLTVSRD